MSHWLTEGGTLGASLRRFTCIVVAGTDRDATAEVALGISTAQAEHRRVVLGDLLDDAPRFAPFRVDDDHHGIVDTLHYGISLARVARPVAGTEGLLFAATGSEIDDYAELLAHPRWSRLIDSFAKSKELLVIAVPVSASGLDDLVMRADGLVLVDSQTPAKVDPTRVIAKVRPAPPPPLSRSPVVPAGAAAASSAPGALRPKPPATAGKTPAGGVARPTGAGKTPTRPSVAVQAPPRPIPAGTAAGKPVPGLNRSVVVGALVTLIVALFVYWLAERSRTQSESPEPMTAAATPSTNAPSAASRRSADPNVADPADSGAAAFAVQIMAANTRAGAILKLQEHGSLLPAATYAPVSIQGTTWYKVVAGAFPTRGGADSLLASLREQKLLDSTEGVVVHVPFSIRIDAIRNPAMIGDMLAQLRMGRNLPVYPLEQRDGTVWIMVGAFETRSEADIYAETLRAINLVPQVVYRKGRMF
jgi:hypothetical protein